MRRCSVKYSRSDLFDGIEIRTVDGEMTFSGVSSDSRRIKEGELFVCHRGLHRDGRQYARSALEKGARAVLSETGIDGIPAEKTVITPNTRVAESFLWHNITGKTSDSMTKIAVTGTAGKTSTALLIRELLSSDGHKVGLISTLGVRSGERTIPLPNGGSAVDDRIGTMTTPDPEPFFRSIEQMAEDGCDTLVYEASSQALELHKTDALCNDIAVFTNLSHEHLDAHGSMEAYFSAKARLAELSDFLVLNADDAYFSRIPALYPAKPHTLVTLMHAEGADTFGVNYRSLGEKGLSYMLVSENAVFRVQTPLIGRASAYNTLEAIAVALRLGADPIAVKETLSSYRGVSGRMERVLTGVSAWDEDADVTVFIDYAHTPEAFRAVLGEAKTFSDKLTALFGCGGDRDRSKRAEMAGIAEEYADRIILTNDNPRTEPPEEILADIRKGFTKENHTVIPNRTDAVQYAIRTAESGEVILLLGKGHERYEITARGMTPFDEYAVARDALRQRMTKRKETKT